MNIHAIKASPGVLNGTRLITNDVVGRQDEARKILPESKAGGL